MTNKQLRRLNTLYNRFTSTLEKKNLSLTGWNDDEGTLKLRKIYQKYQSQLIQEGFIPGY